MWGEGRSYGMVAWSYGMGRGGFGVFWGGGVVSHLWGSAVGYWFHAERLAALRHRGLQEGGQTDARGSTARAVLGTACLKYRVGLA